ncbi:nucleoside deaminase [Natribacillus halophilus]|uniref:Guanine deaminase n=1 Tax=Natribacillus halophilus TaxID=549003 RepID=A0A1G8KQ86_9BACI|nr:nucleoside deaminase [Natribacillus halophilus]SDI45549.1 guanine deaminase [Natribacillus halophilus]
MSKEQFMDRAIEVACETIQRGNTPFGAVIVKDGEIISEEANEATSDNDPTAHAELLAIRTAGKKLGSESLAGCELYASGEPCPMCLGAIYNAGIEDVYVAYATEEAAEYGLASRYVYEQVAKPSAKRDIPFIPLKPEQSRHPYEVWKNS